MSTKSGLLNFGGIRLPNGAENLLAILLLFCDGLILHFLFVELFKFWLRNFQEIEIYLRSYHNVKWYLLGLYLFFAFISGCYNIRKFRTASDNFSSLMKAILLTTFSFYMAAFFSRELTIYAHSFPRPIFALATIGSLIVLFLLRAAITCVFKPHAILLKAIIIGDIAEGRRIITHFHRKGGVRFRIIRTMSANEIDELAAEVLLKHVHEIFVTDPTINLDKFWGHIYYDRKEKPHDFNVRITIDSKKASGGAGLKSLDDYPLITIPSSPLTPMQCFVKRTFDILFSIFALIITSPIMLLTSILVRLDSPGPVFYKQRRVGLYGKDYDVIKFRSMRTGSEATNGPTVSTADDPRVSKFGKFIRHFGIDELPQFFLVLTGDMSVVGPRPERPYFVDKYYEFQGRRLASKPGVTGLAAVNSRYYLNLTDKVTYDYYYLDNYSLTLDLKIIFQTIWVLIFKSDSSIPENSEN